MTEAWSRLRALMGEPVYIPAQVPWELAPADLGVQLPSDYRAFIDLYGGVNLNGEWGVFTPKRNSRFLDVPGGMAGWRFEADINLRDQVEGEEQWWDQQDPTPVFPDPGGLLPWGSNSNHNQCCWQTTGPDPEQWPVTVFYDDRLDHFDGGFAEFLLTVLTGGYTAEAELLVLADPDVWGPQLPRPLWSPGEDWAGRNWGLEWGIEGFPTEPRSTEMPWVRK
ncbi:MULTISPECIES: SMI1/KNR4 family protein [Kitasatospora]|uniref:Knr4/Smi1-like domain-containing protein n=1 Tax=Kitasatospora cystarginea TaxID=58350 RepID=A0ABN3EYW4_9ACTN